VRQLFDAHDLCLTQSAVSRQIQSLEQHLGTSLLMRRHRAITLTDAGQQLFQLASPWLDRLADFTQSVNPERRPRPVIVTASIGVTSLWILPSLGGFQAAHPHIDVRVAANNRILDLKQEGIDLAIRYCPQAHAPAGALRLFGEEVVPVAHKSVAAEAFRNHEALLQQVFLELDDQARPWLRWSDWLGAQGLPDAKPKAYLHFNRYDQVIQAAIEGHGVALGRVALVLPMLKDGRLVAQPDADIGRSDYAYWLVQASQSPRREVQAFIDWMIQKAQLASGYLAEVQDSSCLSIGQKSPRRSRAAATAKKKKTGA
jgi:DNA-binding transcriptional LysR family regulator